MPPQPVEHHQAHLLLDFIAIGRIRKKYHYVPSSTFFFLLFVLFKTFLTAEIYRLSFDRRPAGMAHGNIGVAKGILYQILAGNL